MVRHRSNSMSLAGEFSSSVRSSGSLERTAGPADPNSSEPASASRPRFRCAHDACSYPGIGFDEADGRPRQLPSSGPRLGYRSGNEISEADVVLGEYAVLDAANEVRLELERLVEFERAPIIRHRRIEQTEGIEDGAEIVARIREVGLDRDRLAVAFGSLIEPAVSLQDESQIVVRLGEIRLQANRLAVARDCVVRSADVPECVRNVVVRCDEVRPERDCRAVARNGFVQLAKLLERARQVVVGHHEVGPQ